MIPKDFDQISKSDIDSLIHNSVREGRTVEYKEQLPGLRDQDRKEFLADVSSFANAAGGDLIYGIVEQRDDDGRPTGLPDSAIGLASVNIDQESNRLEGSIRDGIEPRIHGVRIQAIDGFRNGPVLMLRIPKSWTGPHMVTYKGSSRFFSRTSAGKAPLDVTEIRAAFLQAEAIPERIRRFREERIGRILAGETPIPLEPGAAVVLHVVPQSVFQSRELVDVAKFDRYITDFIPIGGFGSNFRPNLDGFVTFFSKGNSYDICYSYTQFFRTGAVEAVDTYVFQSANNNRKAIPPVSFEDEIIKVFVRFMIAYRKLDVEAPFVVMLSLIGVKGFEMYVGDMFIRTPTGIDRDVVIIPEFVFENVDVDAAELLRPVFDLVWQACGHRGSRNYNEDGKRVSR